MKGCAAAALVLALATLAACEERPCFLDALEDHRDELERCDPGDECVVNEQTQCFGAYNAAKQDLIDSLAASSSRRGNCLEGFCGPRFSPRCEDHRCVSDPDPSRKLPCNPVAQQGCETEEKCTQLVIQDEPLLVRTGCAPIGVDPVEIGGACMGGQAGFSGGADDCIAGAYCNEGTCQRLCSNRLGIVWGCPDGQVCAQPPDTDFFADLTLPVGLCQPPSD